MGSKCIHVAINGEFMKSSREGGSKVNFVDG